MVLVRARFSGRADEIDSGPALLLVSDTGSMSVADIGSKSESDNNGA